MKIAHIINPVKKGPESDLFMAQPITFRSLIEAQKNVNHCIKIELLSTSYEEDDIKIPTKIREVDFLKRSVLDIGRFQQKRKLPLIKDIFDIGINASDADFLIYSNVDISPMPYFYNYIAEEISFHDAIVINRRTIEMPKNSGIPLSILYSQIGTNHPGYDCFIFNKEIYNKFFFGNACIGANWIGRIIICNLIAYSENFSLVKDSHLTFHLGDDRSWKTIANIDFDEHNENELRKLMIKLKNDNLLKKHPLLEQTYKEFVLEKKDPDPSRPKKVGKFLKLPDANLETSLLYRNYRPSDSWTDKKDNILKQDPVFIVGYPRSGTTLLQSLVSTQFASAVFPETHFFSIIRSKLILNNDRIQSDCLKEILMFISDKLHISRQLEKYIIEITHAGELSPKMLFEAIVFDQLARHMPSSEIPNVNWIEKTPDHVYYLDVINRFYPSSKIIFVIRNPEKAIISRRKHFDWNQEASWPIETHIHKWIVSIKAAESFEKVNPGRVFFAKFEDLVMDRNYEIKKICKFLNVKYREELIRNYKIHSEQQCLPWETWKIDAKKGISSNIALRENLKLSNKERRIIIDFAKPYLIKYDYYKNLKISLSKIKSFFKI